MPDRTFRFSSFELDERSGELRKHGTRIKIQEQPFQILLLLLEEPGKVVEREAIRGKLWPADTFVDFDNAISSAVRKLREALGDNADRPRFIETLPRRGYRFIAPIEAQSPVPQQLPPEPPTPPKQPGIRVVPVALGALLILGLASWWLLANFKRSIPPMLPLPLTAAEGTEDSPTFSPDGNQIAYTWADPASDNIAHIYIRTIGSGRSVPITSGAKADSTVSWSPDGRTIAFIRNEGERSTIYTTSPAGGMERRIRDGHFAGRITWSADNRSLVVAERNSWNDVESLYLISTEDGEKTRLTTPPDANSEDQDPAFSPDGGSLLFTRCRYRYTCGLYLLKISPGNRPVGGPALLVDFKAVILGAAWSANGKAAVYPSYIDKTYNPHLMRVPIQPGAHPEPLPYTGEQAFAPVIAMRGNRMAYVQNLSDFDLLRIQPGKPTQTFASSTRDERSPQYSPDGKRVAFQSNRSGSMNVWVCDSDGKNPVQLTNAPEFSGSPRWSPDGQSISFDRHLKSGWHIFVMASDGGHVRQLTSDQGDEVIANWSRDGKWIYYASNRTGRFEVWKAPSTGGKGHQVTRHGGYVAYEAPDGNSLYYTKIPENLSLSNSLWELPASGTEERRVPIESIRSRAYTVTKDGIYYIPVPDTGGQASIRLYSFANKKDEEITPLGSMGFGLSVSPDRSSILVATTSRTGSNVMVVENFK